MIIPSHLPAALQTLVGIIVYQISMDRVGVTLTCHFFITPRSSSKSIPPQHFTLQRHPSCLAGDEAPGYPRCAVASLIYIHCSASRISTSRHRTLPLPRQGTRSSYRSTLRIPTPWESELQTARPYVRRWASPCSILGVFWTTSQNPPHPCRFRPFSSPRAVLNTAIRPLKRISLAR